MISEEQHERASLYALGAFAEQEEAAFEAELAEDAELRELTRSLQSTISQLRETLQDQL